MMEQPHIHPEVKAEILTQLPPKIEDAFLQLCQIEWYNGGINAILKILLICRDILKKPEYFQDFHTKNYNSLFHSVYLFHNGETVKACALLLSFLKFQTHANQNYILGLILPYYIVTILHCQRERFREGGYFENDHYMILLRNSHVLNHLSYLTPPNPNQKFYRCWRHISNFQIIIKTLLRRNMTMDLELQIYLLVWISMEFLKVSDKRTYLRGLLFPNIANYPNEQSLLKMKDGTLYININYDDNQFYLPAFGKTPEISFDIDYRQILLLDYPFHFVETILRGRIVEMLQGSSKPDLIEESTQEVTDKIKDIINPPPPPQNKTKKKKKKNSNNTPQMTLDEYYLLTGKATPSQSSPPAVAEQQTPKKGGKKYLWSNVLGAEIVQQEPTPPVPVPLPEVNKQPIRILTKPNPKPQPIPTPKPLPPQNPTPPTSQSTTQDTVDTTDWEDDELDEVNIGEDSLFQQTWEKRARAARVIWNFLKRASHQNRSESISETQLFETTTTPDGLCVACGEMNTAHYMLASHIEKVGQWNNAKEHYLLLQDLYDNFSQTYEVLMSLDGMLFHSLDGDEFSHELEICLEEISEQSLRADYDKKDWMAFIRKHKNASQLLDIYHSQFKLLKSRSMQ
eukprot:TRINITY_DN22349_c0_g1_i1.p1 TRINITY_DN22349_c0_g1~~TRINITY_DN22349_c0_g1_i1.p1  ORF type:complete len:685 (+),score=182.76 TRINITY_DN22349_c0_g1_i1:179-2056(+)